MPVQIIEMLIPKSNTRTRPGIKRDPDSITIHETDNTNVRANARAHALLQFNGNARQASWHLQVDDEPEVYKSVPYDEVAWAGGDGNGPGNSRSIHIEVCVNRDGNYLKAIDNTIKVVKYLLNIFPKIKKIDVVQHNKWSGKHCPRYLREGSKGIDWKSFISKIDSTVEVAIKPKEEPPYTSTNGNFLKGDKVRVKKTATTYATGQPIASHVKGSTYTILQQGSNRMLLDVIMSWVKTSDLELIEDTKQPSKPSTPAKKPATPSKPKPATIEQLADEVIAGKHGTGDVRKKSLGSNYTAVQARVNEKLGAKLTTSKPSAPTFKVGNKVKIKSSANKYSRVNVDIPTKHKNKSYTIQQIGGDDVLIKELYSWVKKADLQ